MCMCVCVCASVCVCMCVLEAFFSLCYSYGRCAFINLSRTQSLRGPWQDKESVKYIAVTFFSHCKSEIVAFLPLNLSPSKLVSRATLTRVNQRCFVG